MSEDSNTQRCIFTYLLRRLSWLGYKMVGNSKRVLELKKPERIGRDERKYPLYLVVPTSF